MWPTFTPPKQRSFQIFSCVVGPCCCCFVGCVTVADERERESSCRRRAAGRLMDGWIGGGLLLQPRFDKESPTTTMPPQQSKSRKSSGGRDDGEACCGGRAGCLGLCVGPPPPRREEGALAWLPLLLGFWGRCRNRPTNDPRFEIYFFHLYYFETVPTIRRCRVYAHSKRLPLNGTKIRPHLGDEASGRVGRWDHHLPPEGVSIHDSRSINQPIDRRPTDESCTQNMRSPALSSDPRLGNMSPPPPPPPPPNPNGSNLKLRWCCWGGSRAPGRRSPTTPIARPWA
jgi:hypothetical protein